MSKSQSDNGDGSKRVAGNAQNQDDILLYLSSLRGEIEDLKRDQREHAPASLQQELLTDLRQDLSAARPTEHAAPAAGEISGVLEGLRSEVASARQESLAGTDKALASMLRELRKELDDLRQEQAATRTSGQDQQLYALFSELRRDIASLKNAKHAPVRDGDGLARVVTELRQDLKKASRRTMPDQTAAAARQERPRDYFAGMAASIAAVALILNAYLMLSGTQKAVTPAQATMSDAAPTVRQAAASDSPIYSALFVPQTSPAGINGAEVHAEAALAKASTILSASATDRNTDEAGYWLKRYLNASQASKVTPRTLTQLGSLYANGIGNAPADYQKARALWEVSSALGDPVAMCFLGRMLEDGIAGPASAANAATWYLRARDAGGCPDLDAAIARTLPR